MTSIEPIEQIRKEHPDQWVAVKVTEEKDGETVAGELLAAADSSNKIWQKIKLSPDYVTYVFHTNGPIKKGYAVMF